MNFPLTLSCKVIALAPQINVSDASGANICYVRQKIMKLKENIEVFTDKSKSQKICEIKANKIIDFSATYRFLDHNGEEFGSVARKGMRSIWKAHYDILKDDQPYMSIDEENPWVKMVDSLVGEIPIIGAFTGYMLNPTYIIKSAAGEDLIRIRKRPAFFESKFVLDKLGNFEADDELRMVVSTIMMVLLEKSRG